MKYCNRNGDKYRLVDEYRGFELAQPKDKSYKTWRKYYTVYCNGQKYSDMVITTRLVFRKIIDNYLNVKEKV